jgi:hypothetical protein
VDPSDLPEARNEATEGHTMIVRTVVRVRHTVELLDRGRSYQVALDHELRVIGVWRDGASQQQGQIRPGPLRGRLEQRAVAAAERAPVGTCLRQLDLCMEETS